MSFRPKTHLKIVLLLGANNEALDKAEPNRHRHLTIRKSKMETPLSSPINTGTTDASFEVVNKDDDWTLVEGGSLKGLKSFIDKSSGTVISLSSELTVDTDRWRGDNGMPSLEEHSQSLKELNLHKNRYIKTLHPSVCKLVQLEKLTLTRCDLLTTLPPQIGDLKNLRVLDLTDASEIVTLPESIGELQK